MRSLNEDLSEHAREKFNYQYDSLLTSSIVDGDAHKPHEQSHVGYFSIACFRVNICLYREKDFLRIFFVINLKILFSVLRFAKIRF